MNGTASKWWWLPGALMTFAGLCFMTPTILHGKFGPAFAVGIAWLIIGPLSLIQAVTARKLAAAGRPLERNEFQFAGERFHASVPLFYLALGACLGAGAAETEESRWWTMIGTGVFAACAVAIWILRGFSKRSAELSSTESRGSASPS